MVKKIIPVVIGITVLIVLLLFFMGSQKNDTFQPESSISGSFDPSATSSARPGDEALKNALNLYVEKRVAGVDLKNGPCLGKIADDWVLDIAHRPRNTVDDKPENQCADFREGRAHHFIELDPDGQLIRSF